MYLLYHNPRCSKSRDCLKIVKNKKKTSRKKSGGQGIGLNSKEIGAIDKQAMMVAENYYKELGWKVTDKSGVYGGGRDLDCKKDGKTIHFPFEY